LPALPVPYLYAFDFVMFFSVPRPYG
jgi:hypothetical protein